MLKQLPNDKQIEEALLGALFIDGRLVEDFFVNGQVEWFYHYRELIDIILSLVLKGNSIDLVIIKNELEAKGKLKGIGGMTKLVEMTEDAQTYNWKTYSDKLEALYKQREIIKEAQKLIDAGYSGESLEQTIESGFTNINRVLNEGTSSSTSLEDNIKLLQKYIDENKGRKLVGYSWGNDWLDKYTLGIRRGKTYRIGSPSGVGKTNLIYGTIKALLEQGAKVMFISLENTIEATYTKFLSSVQGVNNIEIETGSIAPDYDWLRKYKDKLILTDQLFDFNEIKREVLKVKPDVVILDYIGLVNIKGVDDDKMFSPYAKRVKEFVQKNKELAWIDLSNLNTSEGEEEIRKFGKFNGSAALRNNTDFGLHMFHYAPFYEYREEIKRDGTPEAYAKFECFKAVTFYISKNRLGPDHIEKVFGINFAKGINYVEVTDASKELWEAL